MTSKPDTAPVPEATLTKQSRLISKILSPAVRLWLRSQVEAVESLKFQIEGGDRQILMGHIPTVTVAAEAVIYQGIHLNQVAVTAQNIRINLPEVLKGKPLRLLTVFPVEGEAHLSQTALSASLQAPLLANALRDLLLPLLASAPSQNEAWGQRLTDIQELQVTIQDDRLLVTGVAIVEQQPTAFAIRTGVQVVDGSCLRFDRPEWLPHPEAAQGQPLTALAEFTADLGAEVNLQELIIANGQIHCRGQVNVVPAPMHEPDPATELK
jgi:hypothetical protein